MPKKYFYPEDLPSFEVASLVFAAATDLGMTGNSEALWKPVISRMYKELIFTVDTFSKVNNDTLILEWSI